MGYINTEQTVRLIETVAEVTRTPVKEPNYWWIPIMVAGITVVGGIIVALIRRKK